jgi:SAM-dependent methyltransferase
MRAVYDRIAPDYAAANSAGMPEMLAQFAPRFVTAARAAAAAANAQEPCTVEVGCGPGRDMAWLEGQGLAAIGVDLSRGMLLQARQRVRGPLLQMDMRRLAFGNTRFHGAWCNAALLHLPRADVPGVLSRIASLLVPRAPLFLSLQGGSGETWEHGAYGHTVDRFFARYSPDEVVAMLVGAGFTVQEQAQRPAGTRLWLQFLALARE